MDTNQAIEQYATITLSDDKVQAFVQFNHIDENFKISAEDFEFLLKAHQIVHGILYDKIKQMTDNPKPFLYEKTLIASGDKPKDGANGYIQYTFNLDDNIRSPLEMDDGKVDYRELKRLNNVKAGELIAEKFPPAEGQHGRSVTGEVLMAKNGKEAHFKIGKNVVLDETKTKLYAVIDGLVTKTDRDKINVFPIYEVNGDVDYHVGNIDFVGNVVIRGNVLPGFKVRADGDIRVIGGVEAAFLEANGSIEITGGVLGQNKAVVKAGANFKSSFVQDATIEAAEEVLITQSIMHSSVRGGKAVYCKGSKGLIVGGIVQAGEIVEARTVGNTMSTPTVIEVGVLPELRNELTELRAGSREQKDNLDKTDKALALLNQMASTGNLSPEKLAMRIKLNNTRKQVIDDIETMKSRMLEIEKSLEDTQLAKIVIINNIYGGSKLVIGRYTRFIKDTFQRVVFRIADGDITMMSH